MLPDFISIFSIWYFLLLMSFVILLVALNPAVYSFYVIPEQGEVGPTAIPPSGCVPGVGWDDSSLSDEEFNYYLFYQEYWRTRCSMKWLSQDEYDELIGYYNGKMYLAALGILGLVINNSRSRKKLKALYYNIKQINLEK